MGEKDTLGLELDLSLLRTGDTIHAPYTMHTSQAALTETRKL